MPPIIIVSPISNPSNVGTYSSLFSLSKPPASHKKMFFYSSAPVNVSHPVAFFHLPLFKTPVMMTFVHFFSPLCSPQLLHTLPFSLSSFFLLFTPDRSLVFSSVMANCWQWFRTSVWRLGNYWTLSHCLRHSVCVCVCARVIESLLINGVIHHVGL